MFMLYYSYQTKSIYFELLYGLRQVGERKAYPRGLSPLLLARGERAKAEALAYLEARARTNATATATAKYRGLSTALRFGRDDVLL
ncbi:MAG: hypothetical protein BGO25_13655 [Acidobacteriales bacterium 59-55]|nr:MAG: hypothetical protein BGO25_13655 [Acidobacteriales bacterium 59-55]